MFPSQKPSGVTVLSTFPLEILDEPIVWIELSDGVRLAARVWRPVTSDERPVPAIFEMIPYRRRDGTLAVDEQIHPFYAGHGLASLRVDIRGSGDSEGLLVDEYLPREQDDAIEIINWIAEQPWCDGNVGMTGLSWGGFNSLQVASRRPEPLKAVTSVGATVDRYNDDIHYKNGCLLNENFGWGTSLTAFTTRPPDPQIVGESWRTMWLERLNNLKFFAEPWFEHQLRDSYWRHGSICEDYDAIKAPVMIVAGWADLYVNAVPGILENLAAPRRAIAGPWAHQFPHLATPGPAIDYLGMALDWWQRWLTDTEDQADPESTYLAYLKCGSRPDPFAAAVKGRWVGLDQWPNPAVEMAHYYLAEPGLQVGECDAPPLPIHSPLDTGATSGEWVPHSLGPEMPLDQRPDDVASLVFDSAPLNQYFDILGSPVLRVCLSSDCPTGNLIARLCDVGPDGASERVCLGVLNLTRREGTDRVKLMPLDEPVAIDLRLDHVAHRFPKGHRIRLALSTAYWPLIWPAADNPTLHLAPVPARLSLPHLADGAALGSPALETARIPEPSNIRTIREPRNDRRLTMDLARGHTALEITDDYGAVEFLDHGMINGGLKQEHYGILLDNPLSASADIHWTLDLSRGDWCVRTETKTRLTCDAEHFHLGARVVAFENDQEIVRREFERSIARLP